jgi:hypothetical protein
MGDVVPTGPMEWGIMAKWHKELCVAKNWAITSLQHKFNLIANMTPPTVILTFWGMSLWPWM